MNVLLIGGQSFIGAYVAKELLEAGHRLTLLVRNIENIIFSNNSSVNYIQADLLIPESIPSKLTEFDAVVYLAHVDSSDNPVAKVESDLLPLLRILENARISGVKRFIYTSSTSALGELSESMSEHRMTIPDKWWCASKAAAEQFVIAARSESSMICSIVRPALTFGKGAVAGARTESYSRFREIALAALSNEDIYMRTNDGTQMTFAGDVAKVYSNLLTANKIGPIYHAVAKERTSWYQVAQSAIAYVGSQSKIVIDSYLDPAVLCSYGTGAIKNDFNLEFKTWPALGDHLEWIITSAKS